MTIPQRSFPILKSILIITIVFINNKYYKIVALVKAKIKKLNLWATSKAQTCLHYHFGVDEKMQKWCIEMTEADKPLHEGLEELNSQSLEKLGK